MTRTTVSPADVAQFSALLDLFGGERPDLVLINSSAGKDSAAMLAHVVRLADAVGLRRSQLVVVHADLGRVEWKGTRELAEAQALRYGLRFEVVRRSEDLLDQVLTRRVNLDAAADRLDAEGRHDEADRKRSAPAWPSSTARYCTSDQKTAQVAKLITRLVDDYRRANPTALFRRVRVLNCLGIRADESPARALKPAVSYDAANWSKAPRKARKATATEPAQDEVPGVPHGKREVVRWLPIFRWTEAQVWAEVERAGLPMHEAYTLGMPRLSCVFCVLAGRRELVVAARHNPELAREYAATEDLVRSTFKNGLSMTEIIAEAGQQPGPDEQQDA